MDKAAMTTIGDAAPGHYGDAATGVTLAECVIAAAWNVQGDARRPEFIATVQALFGITLPTVPNTTARGADLSAFWLGPASWLLVAGGRSPLVDFAPRRDALNAPGGALFDVSASRVAWTIAGPRAQDVLASGCPLDFHARTFAAGACAQSLFGHIGVLITKRDDTPTFLVMAARSFARDALRALCLPAAQYGYDVLPPRPFTPA